MKMYNGSSIVDVHRDQIPILKAVGWKVIDPKQVVKLSEEINKQVAIETKAVKKALEKVIEDSVGEVVVAEKKEVAVVEKKEVEEKEPVVKEKADGPAVGDGPVVGAGASVEGNKKVVKRRATTK